MTLLTDYSLLCIIGMGGVQVP